MALECLKSTVESDDRGHYWRTSEWREKALQGNNADSGWNDAARAKHAPEVLEAYEQVPPSVIYAMNIAYLCGQMAGADLGDDGFTGWLVRAMKDTGTQINATMECFYAVAAVTDHTEYLPPNYERKAA